MVEPLRPRSVEFAGHGLEPGLYVVGHSRVGDTDLPTLPSISPNSFSRGSDQLRQLSHFAEGDIVRIDPRARKLHIVLSSRSNANTLLVTERCENRCSFCSQPPNERDDVHLYQDAALAILNFGGSDLVGISGGEPTFNSSAFLTLLKTLRDFGNKTPLHILTNGRSFSDRDFAQKVAGLVSSRSVFWGVPLYAHRASLHDELVRAEGAFCQTIQGLLNLASVHQNVELRIVPTSANAKILPNIVGFVSLSFPCVGVISIMNLEPMGWGRRNYDQLYVPIRELHQSLEDAVEVAERAGVPVRLFNYPLCLLSESLRPYAQKSISDWKNFYPDECQPCALRTECGGFFSSALGRFAEPVEVQR